MLFVAFTDYIHVIISNKLEAKGNLKRILLIIDLLIDLTLLGYFKYADFIVGIINGLSGVGIPAPNVALPVGISFFTFQSMSYSMDYYRGKTVPEKNYLDYLTYVSMFPQLVAGPIVRYSDIRERLHNRKVDITAFSDGVSRFCTGLFKKVLLANQIGKLWDNALAAISGGNASISFAWLGALAFTLQLYFDFSAYSDMAIGMGKMMGFEFPENFQYPLSAVSITDFWRKWHISLSTWFRDYVYIPLGGNRVCVLKHLRNMFIVWFLTGLWHGAAWNFVIWGLWHGCFLALEKYVWGKKIEKMPSIIGHIYALFIVIVGFTIFAVDDMSKLAVYLKTMFGLSGGSIIASDILWYGSNYGLILIIAIVLSFPVYEICGRYADRKVTSVFKMMGTVGLFILSIAFLVSDSYNPFLYFRF